MLLCAALEPVDEATAGQGPYIPEPMVFDLVRPLGAARGETEINLLGIIPLGRRAGRLSEVPDPLGVIPQRRTLPDYQLSPEIETTLWDGVAVEFEVPLEEGRVAAFKPALQLTFGTAFDARFIHGLQVIAQYETSPRLWAPTAVYIAGFRIDPVWSVLGMVGARGEFGGEIRRHRTEMLVNGNVFADIAPRLVSGLEVNYGQLIGGEVSTLIIPQIHYGPAKGWIVQAGAGARLTSRFTIPEVGFRIIREF